MNLSILRLILFVLFLTFKSTCTKELTDDELTRNVQNLEFTNSISQFSKINPIDRSNELFSKDEQTLKKPISCDRVDSEFFHYLLKRYNKDNQQIGRMRRLCNNLEYAATNCQKSDSNLFDLIQNTDQLNEDDFNFSQSVIRLCPLILFRLHKQTCTVKANSENLSSHPRPHPKHIWTFAFLFVTIIR